MNTLIFRTVAPFLTALMLLFSIFVLLRGHNEPGGGFVAGLVVAIALIMQYIASGYGWAAARMRVDAQSYIGAGVAIAGLTGVAAFLFGRPFLTSTFGYLTWPVVGKFEVASAMAFDLGVFLTVVGVMVLSLAQLSRVSRRIDPAPDNQEPMDVRLEPSASRAREG